MDSTVLNKSNQNYKPAFENDDSDIRFAEPLAYFNFTNGDKEKWELKVLIIIIIENLLSLLSSSFLLLVLVPAETLGTSH